MTEDFETGDLENSNENDLLEEEVDQLNDLTFGDEINWAYDNKISEKDDSNFERFQFDEIESNSGENESTFEDKSKNYNEDLLGLKGSFFNFGLFKSAQRGDDEQPLNNNRDVEFDLAMGKLDLLDIEEDKSDCGNNICTSDLGFGDFNIQPLAELMKYSESLHVQFKFHQKSSSNTQFLSSIVAKHLNMLSKKVSQLSLPIDVLAQLRYFRILTTFVDIDSRINDVRFTTNDPQIKNREINFLIQQFVSQSPQQQVELAEIHPFYDSLNKCLCLQRFTQQLSHNQSRPCLVPDIDLNNGGWMSQSERDWLIKLQTRNLITGNPYVHDYYYTTVTFKEMTLTRQAEIDSNGRSDKPEPISLLPSPITADQLGAGIDPTQDGLSPKYIPTQFANSLGTVTASNLYTPRKTIDVPQRQRRTKNTEVARNDGYLTVRVYRELLGLIESLYSIVLRVDEVDKSLSKMIVAQHHSRSTFVSYRSHLLRALMTIVSDEETVVRLWSVSKGVAIQVSVLAIVDTAQFAELLVLLGQNSSSISQSSCFNAYHMSVRAAIGSRLPMMTKDELSLIIARIFNNLGSPKTTSITQEPSLTGFCRSEFGLHIVFTVLDAFVTVTAEDKSNINSLVNVVLKHCDSKTITRNIVQQFPVLFPGSVD